MDRIDTSCTDVQAALPLFVGYDLEAPEMETVAGHLDTCPTCHALAGRAQSAREVLWTLRDEPSVDTPDLWSGIRSELVREGRIEARPILSPGPRRVWFGGVAAAAAAVLLVTLAQVFDPASNNPVAPLASSVSPTTELRPNGTLDMRTQRVHPVALTRSQFRGTPGHGASQGIVTVSGGAGAALPRVFPVSAGTQDLRQAWSMPAHTHGRPGPSTRPGLGGRLVPAGPDSEHLIDSALPFGAELVLPRPSSGTNGSSLVGGRRRLH